MKVTIDPEAWRADEIRTFDLAIRKWARRNFYRTKLLEELDRTLPDYERPLKHMHRKYKPFSLLKAIKSILP